MDNNKIALLVIIVSFIIITLLLDSTWPVPKKEGLDSLIKISYWIAFGCMLFFTLINTVPEFFGEMKTYIIDKEKIFLTVQIVFIALVISVNIVVGGGVKSPYIAFLSSFPIFSMVLLFESITIKNCIKGIGIMAGALLTIVLLVPFYSWLTGSSIVEEKTLIQEFLQSKDFIMLTISLVVITSLSNVVSLYAGAR